MSSPPGYDALLWGAAWVRRTDRGVVRLRGADRVTWLQGLVTNDVSAIAAGQRIYSAYLTPQGRMITDLWVVATPDTLLLDVPAALASSLVARLDGLIFAEDVQIDDASRGMAVLHIFGAPATDGTDADTAGTDGTDAATDFTDAQMTGWLEIGDATFGVPSRVAYVPVQEVDQFASKRLGSHLEVGLDALDVLRVEAGVPRFMVDMTEDTIPLEAGLEDRAISFTKGCYVGQEIIVRVTTRGGGRVARKLVGLRLEDGAGPPPAGAAVHAGERAVGRVTSAVFSPRCAGVIALGYVHRDFTEPGTRLEVHYDARSLAATVHALPFVAPAP
jgi:folate-binding protein YgfZ